MNKQSHRTLYLAFFFFSVLLTSCVPHRKLVLFSDDHVPEQKIFGKEDTTVTLDGKVEEIQPPSELVVKPDDILYIYVYSLNQDIAAPYNIVPGEQQRNSVDPVTQGYLVDKDGYIDYPLLGKIYVENLTRDQIKDELEKLLIESGSLVQPSVKVRLINFTVSVLGEVRRPGRLLFDEENITILEAISLAGGFGDLANREKVLVFRERDGKRSYAELNFLSTEIYDSPYLYLEQNDVIYIEPLTAKTSAVASAPLRYINILGAVVGTVVGAILIIERLGQ